MAKVKVNRELCKGCRLCIGQCPRGALVLSEEVNRRGSRFVTVREGYMCTGCLNCVTVCPDAAISIFGEEGEP